MVGKGDFSKERCNMESDNVLRARAIEVMLDRDIITENEAKDLKAADPMKAIWMFSKLPKEKLTESSSKKAKAKAAADKIECAPLLASIVSKGLCSDVSRLSDLNAEGLRGYIETVTRLSASSNRKWEDLSNKERAELHARDKAAYKACVREYEVRTGHSLGGHR